AWRGGWFHTGDVVRQDADGLLYFVDRKKNIIRRAGENIAAAEIEAVIQAHDEVAQVAVLAVPDDVREEEVMACVVPMPGVVAGAALADRIFDWCMERLAYFKAPGWLLFVASLPTTGTQKVQKTQIFPTGEDPRRRPGVLALLAPGDLRRHRPRVGGAAGGLLRAARVVAGGGDGRARGRLGQPVGVSRGATASPGRPERVGVEARHGFAGARRAVGGFGGPFRGPPFTRSGRLRRRGGAR